jgi:hypothetical protein
MKTLLIKPKSKPLVIKRAGVPEPSKGETDSSERRAASWKKWTEGASRKTPTFNTK